MSRTYCGSQQQDVADDGILISSCHRLIDGTGEQVIERPAGLTVPSQHVSHPPRIHASTWQQWRTAK